MEEPVRVLPTTRFRMSSSLRNFPAKRMRNCVSAPLTFPVGKSRLAVCTAWATCRSDKPYCSSRLLLILIRISRSSPPSTVTCATPLTWAISGTRRFRTRSVKPDPAMSARTAKRRTGSSDKANLLMTGARTSFGKLGMIWLILRCISCTVLSMSVSWLVSTATKHTFSLEPTWIFSMPSIEEIASSIGLATPFSTSAGEAPGYRAMIVTTGGSNFGTNSMGKLK